MPTSALFPCSLLGRQRLRPGNGQTVLRCCSPAAQRQPAWPSQVRGPKQPEWIGQCRAPRHSCLTRNRIFRLDQPSSGWPSDDPHL